MKYFAIYDWYNGTIYDSGKGVKAMLKSVNDAIALLYNGDIDIDMKVFVSERKIHWNQQVYKSETLTKKGARFIYSNECWDIGVNDLKQIVASLDRKRKDDLLLALIGELFEDNFQDPYTKIEQSIDVLENITDLNNLTVLLYE